MTFTSGRPGQSPGELWKLQNELLAKAEVLLGPRSKKIYQPTYSDRGPRLINTPSLDGAYAGLSINAAGYWPTAVFELAHETVHLLDPSVGYTNYLEECVAVVFSVEMSRLMTSHPMQPTNFPIYMEAWRLVQVAFDDVFAAAKAIRQQCGSLGTATAEGLVSLFPEREPEVLGKLAERCAPR